MNRIKSFNGYTIFQAGPRDVKKHGFTEGSFYVYFTSDVRDFGIANSSPEFEDCGSLEEAAANCAGNFAIAKEIVENRTTAASMTEILEVEAQLDAAINYNAANVDVSAYPYCTATALCKSGGPVSVLNDCISSHSITIKDISTKTGIQYELLSRTLASKRKLKADELVALCRVLNLGLDNFRKSIPTPVYIDRENAMRSEGAQEMSPFRHLEIHMAAQNVISAHSVTRFPVSVSSICKSMGIAVRSYRLAAEAMRLLRLTELAKSADGFSISLKGKRMLILYNEQCTASRNRFTLAHELGHILLGHLNRNGCTNIEYEADLFAAELLAPSGALNAAGANSVEKVMAVCGIDEHDASFCLKVASCAHW